jgi:hypothetical protein
MDERNGHRKSASWSGASARFGSRSAAGSSLGGSWPDPPQAAFLETLLARGRNVPTDHHPDLLGVAVIRYAQKASTANLAERVLNLQTHAAMAAIVTAGRSSRPAVSPPLRQRKEL